LNGYSFNGALGVVHIDVHVTLGLVFSPDDVIGNVIEILLRFFLFSLCKLLKKVFKLVISEHLLLLQREVAMRSLFLKIQAFKDAFLSERVPSLGDIGSPEMVHADETLEMFKDGVHVDLKFSVVVVHFVKLIL
jgi:hypothetical protein